MLLKFYDFEFNLLHTEQRCTSVKWNIYYNDIGTFEAHFPFSCDTAKLIMDSLNPAEGKYIVVTEQKKSAIIIGYRLKDDFAVYGRTCNWILSKRITKKFDNLSGTCDALARGFVEQAFSDVDNFVLGSELTLADSITFSKDRNLLTSDAVKECLKLQSCGHTVDFDAHGKRWVYSSLCGEEKDLILSEANKNAYGTELIYDILDLADSGYYEKSVESGDASLQTTYLTTEGTKSGIYRWEALLDGNAEEDALTDLASKKITDEVNFKTRDIRLGKDYEIGDIFKIQIIKGSYRKTVKRRVTGAELSLSDEISSEQPIFEEV